MQEIKKLVSTLETERGVIEESRAPDLRRLGQIRRRLTFLFGLILLLG